MSIDPTRHFLYAPQVATGFIDAYSIHQTTGALTAIVGSASGRGPYTLALSTDGKYLLTGDTGNAANENGTSGFTSYSVNSTTGALTFVDQIDTATYPLNMLAYSATAFFVSDSSGNHIQNVTLPNTGHIKSLSTAGTTGALQALS